MFSFSRLNILLWLLVSVCFTLHFAGLCHSGPVARKAKSFLAVSSTHIYLSCEPRSFFYHTETWLGHLCNHLIFDTQACLFPRNPMPRTSGTLSPLAAFSRPRLHHPRSGSIRYHPSCPESLHPV